jgi:ubiquinone/menaquinone biosynthesis C-methylase UbiE
MDAFDYNQGEMHLRYDRARNLASETVALWMERLAAHTSHAGVEVRAVADVGCGTGRFSLALARYFAANVYGVDPSQKMLGVAREALAESGSEEARVTFEEGAAERIPLEDASVDLVFISMAYHHLRDRAAACAEFRRILRPTGRLCVRTSTREHADSYLWLSFFPEAREIEMRRTPSGVELRSFVEAHGFKLEAHEVVRQTLARDLAEYYERISLRGLSTLQAIPDAAFAEGLARLRAFCDSQPTQQPVQEEIDLFVFSRDD